MPMGNSHMHKNSKDKDQIGCFAGNLERLAHSRKVEYCQGTQEIMGHGGKVVSSLRRASSCLRLRGLC